MGFDAATMAKTMKTQADGINVIGKSSVPAGYGKEDVPQITVSHPHLNNGRPTNVPAQWGKETSPFPPNTEEAMKWAAERAIKAGLEYPFFSTPEEAASAMGRGKGTY